ncbi:PTS transporter subunit EIIC [Brenneria populi subsp. brevivirga]|uniref:PTS sugar transporter subunit IIC n=1 Tax=Brenneria populi TaxID=1505588 RepID=UPI002E178B66|nr:PTS transporter subunit EIIC [Brenneria populi subsp. brevivirga]
MSNFIFDFIENKVTPIAAIAGTQRHIMAVRDGFIGAMPFMIVGSFLLIFAFPPFAPDTTFFIGKLWLSVAKAYFDEIMIPYYMSMGIMACYISAGIAYNLAQSYKLDAFSCAMFSLMSFLLIASPAVDGSLPIAYLGGSGIFTAIIISIFCTELMRFLKAKNIGIKLPEQVPDKIRHSFNLLIPAIIVVCTIYPLNVFLSHRFGMLLPEIIMAMFMPLISAADSLPAVLIAVLLCQMLWFSGINGGAIVGGILAPFYLINLGLNQAALAAGQPIPHIFAEAFWAFFINLGGSGATLALAILYLRSRAIHLKAIGKLSIVPCFFNINEPLIFGSPIVMNPLLFFPFILAPVVNAIIAWVAASAGLIGKVVSLVPWTTPAPFGAAWGAGWMLNNAVLVLILIAIDILIYLPFFKIYEKQLLAQEEAAKAA